MKFTIFLVTISMLLIEGMSIDPPIWPNAFSQSYSVNFGTYNTTGRLWYDYDHQGQRYDYANGQSQNACGFFSTVNTSCTLLMRQSMAYFIQPLKQLCCYFQGSYIYPPDWMLQRSFIYKGQQQLDSQSYYYWQKDTTSVSQKYYADKSEHRIPRRFSTGSDFTYDFWANTYSEDDIDQSVFLIPMYCNRSCTFYLKDQSKQNQIIQKVRELTFWGMKALRTQ